MATSLTPARSARLLWMLFVALLVAGAPVPGSAADAGPVPLGKERCSPNVDRFRDIDGDGRPEVCILSCRFFSSDDRITIYDTGDDMVYSADWRKAVDFRNDVWVFDARSDGTAELIVIFQEDEAGLRAHLYDDRSGDRSVLYQVRRGQVEVLEPGPRAEMIARDGSWYAADNTINMNVTFRLDGMLTAYEYSISTLDENRERTRPDGQVDLEVEIVDTEQDGRVDLEIVRERVTEQWKEAYGSTANEEGMLTVMLRRALHGRLYAPEGYVLWPFLGSGHFYLLLDYGESVPPVQMDWDQAVLRTFVETVPTRGGEVNYFVKAYQMRDGLVNAVFGENPFAFYDLASDGDGEPELIVRAGTNIDSDGMPYVAVLRYTWDQDNDASADYQLHLWSRNQVEEIHSYPGFGLLHIGYERLPQWVVEQTWLASVFTVPEGYRAGLGEGIYEDFYHRGKIEAQISSGNEIESCYVPMRIGERVEYNFKTSGIPLLYFSPVDKKLHLLSASAGTWIVDAELAPKRYGVSDFSVQDIRACQVASHVKVEYGNLNGDAYLDRWTYYEEDTRTADLASWGPFLVFWAGDELRIKGVPAAPSLFETAPPVDLGSWLELQDLIQQNGGGAQGVPSLSAYYHGMPGPELVWRGVRLLRPLDRGTALQVLVSVADSARQAQDTLFAGRFEDSLRLEQGSYLVTVAESGLAVAPISEGQRLQVSAISVSKPSEFGGMDDLVEREPLKLAATVANSGYADGAVRVSLYLGTPDAGGKEIDQQTISVPALGTTDLTFFWVAVAGEHDLYLLAEPLEPTEAAPEPATSHLSLRARPRAKPSVWQSVVVQRNPHFLIPVLSALLLVVLVLVRKVIELG